MIDFTPNACLITSVRMHLQIGAAQKPLLFGSTGSDDPDGSPLKMLSPAIVVRTAHSLLAGNWTWRRSVIEQIYSGCCLSSIMASQACPCAFSSLQSREIGFTPALLVILS